MHLNDKQRAAVEDERDVLQLTACAGSGKTEVLARRVVHALQRGAPPESIIAFTFTDRAAAELKDRIEQRSRELGTGAGTGAGAESLAPTARGLFVGTLHAFALDLLRCAGGLHETFDVLPEEREWAFVLRYARRLGIVEAYARTRGRDRARVAAAPAVDAFLDAAGFVHNERIDRDTLRGADPQFAALLERYERLLEQAHLFSFGTAIARACDHLVDGDPIYERLRGRVRHVFVDEYQDLNPAQEALVRSLRALGARLTVVGDDDQAIYQWRGGDARLFVDFVARFASAHSLDLDDNFRSRPAIVRTAAAVAARIPGRRAKHMQPVRPGTGAAVEGLEAADAQDEAVRVVQRIRSLLDGGYAPGDIAILFRSVRTSAGPYIEQLRRQGIALRMQGKLSLLSRPAVALVARVLVLWSGGSWYPEPYACELVTPGRLAEDLQALLECPQAVAQHAIGQAAALGQRLAAEGCFDLVGLYNDLIRTLGLPGRGPDAPAHESGLGRLSQLLAEFEHAQRRAGPRLEPAPGSGDEPRAVDPPGAHEERAQEAHFLVPDELPAAAESITATRVGGAPGEILLRRLKSFLEAFARSAVEERCETAADTGNAVQLMTIHQSKGLEFPVVFVPALVQGRFPSALVGRRREWMLPEALLGEARQRYEGSTADEQRLFYVALTRARELLVVSWFSGRPAPLVTLLEPAARARDMLPLGGVAAAPPPRPDPGDRQILDTDFGALATYDECGFKYRLRYLCGFAPPIAHELGFGKVLHHVLADLAREVLRGGRPTPQLADAILERDFYLPFAGVIKKDRLREAARRRLHGFLERNANLLERVIEPELAFEVPLAGARVRGRIDLLARAEAGGSRQVILVDYKTSENGAPGELHKNQLRLYAEAARRLGYDPVGLVIHDLQLDRGRPHVVADDPGARADFREKLAGWVGGIQAGRFDPCRDAGTCRRCDFRAFCRHAPGQRQHASPSSIAIDTHSL